MAISNSYPGNQNVAELFEAQVARKPEAVAVVWGSQQLTYGELNTRANQLAHLLRQRGVKPEDAVGIHLERSPTLITALLAVCKSGGSYVPLDTTYPAERLAFMLQDTGARHVITESAVAGRLPVHEAATISLEEFYSEVSQQPQENLPHVACGENRAYVMYTSGSTGQPKGIEILHRGIARLVSNAEYAPLGPSDRVAQIANCAFDASTWEIWGALLNGAQLVGVHQDTVLSPQSFAAMIERQRITSMFITTALFHLMAKEAPGAFRGVRNLLTGGEAMSPSAMREILDHGAPNRMVHVYGPTESTTFATWHLVEEVPDDAVSVPIGRPLQYTQAYVLDAQLRPVPAGEVGELHIGGDGLARGYVNRPELTMERFIESPFHSGERLYKTGDLVRCLPQGSIDFVGRADFQVKIRGFRIELGEIQAVLRQSPAVSDVAVLVREDTPGDKRLVAYVVPQNQTLLSGGMKVASNALRAAAKQSLPAYMVPAAFVWLRALPLTPNGKIDRETLLAIDVVSEIADGEFAAPATPTEIRLASIWSKLLGVACPSACDSFFDQGGNSLLAAQLLVRVEEAFLVEFPVSRFFAEPTIAQLARHLDAVLAGEKIAPVPAADLRADCVLDGDIHPDGFQSRACGEPKRIFLTGATGFLGAFLLDGLLNRTGATVYCLVRAASQEEGAMRVRANRRKYGLPTTNEHRIVPVLGDLTQMRFGLDAGRFDQLASQMDAIYHCAAHVSYVEPYALHRPVNVIGTREVLRFACKGGATPVHYISTIGLFGPVGYFANVTDIREDSDIDLSEKHLPMDMGYSMSKWVAEKLVFSARDRGLPVTVYRPGFIMGHSRTGVSNVDDFMSRLIAGCVEMGSYPGLSAQRKEFVPVDYVSDAIVHLSRKPSTVNRNFHLVPPDPAKSMGFIEFFEMIATFGHKLRKLTYAEWRGALFQHVKGREKSVLMPLVSVLTEKVYENALSRWELHERMPRFHCDNTNTELEGTSIQCPPMDRALLATYLQYLAERGLLPSTEASRPLPARVHGRRRAAVLA